MARLIGPDEACRLVYLTTGVDKGKAAAQGAPAVIYADAALTVPADIRSLAGAVVPGAAVIVDAFSKLPLFQFPDGADTVYTSIYGGPAVPLYARVDDRLDTLAVASSRLLWDVQAAGTVKGDGSTDDTTALQAMIDASPAGATVFFPAGTYLVSAPIIMRPGRAYVGSGHVLGGGAIIQQKAGANITNGAGLSGILVAAAWAANATGCDGGVLVENLAVNGNKAANPSSTAAGIVLCNFWARIENCYVTETPSHGILLTDRTANGSNLILNSASENRLVANKISNTGGDGVHQTCANNISNQDGWLVDHLISGTSGSGIAFDRGSGWVLRRNHLYSIAADGISLGACFATVVESNEIENFGEANGAGTFYAGIYVSQLNGRGSHVRGNYIGCGEPSVRASTYHLLKINAASGQTDAQAVVTDNILKGANTPAAIGLVVQHSAGGVLAVNAGNNRIDNVYAPQYIAGGDTVVDPQAPVPAVRLYKTGSTTPVNATETPVPLGVINYNRDATFFNTGTANTVKILVYGLYLVVVDMNFEGGTSGYRGTLLKVNGTIVREAANTATDARPGIVAALILNPNDLVTVSTYTTGGTPPAVNGVNAKDVGLAVTRLGN